MHPYYISRIVRLMFEHSQCSMFLYVFVMLFNYVSITVPTESKVAIWAVDAQAISLQQFVILAASCPGKSPGGGRFVRKAGSDSVSVWNIILYWDRSQHDEIRRGDINTP